MQQLCVWSSRLCSLRGQHPQLLRCGSHSIEDPSPFPDQCPIVPFLSPQTADSSAWWMGEVAVLGEWRSLTRAPGAPSVMTAGTWTMPTWCASSWTVEKPSEPWTLLTSGREEGPSGWMIWNAQERSLMCGSALPRAGVGTIVIMEKMQESSAQVWSMYCPVAKWMESFKEVGIWPKEQ